MELRQLRYFCAIADHGSFTRAAAACRVAQPSLSQQILNLEQELGRPLLERGARGARLTPAGDAFLQHARAIVQESELALQRVARRSAGLAGRVTVGIIPTLAPFLLAEPLARVARLHPAIGIRVVEGRTPRLIEQLAAGQLDFAILSDLTASDRRRWSLHVRELFRDALVLAVASSHPLARHPRSISLADIPRRELIVLSDGHCLAARTLRLCRIGRGEVRFECDQLDTLVSLVGAGLGVGIVPGLAVQHPGWSDTVVICRFRAPEPTRQINVTHRRARPLSPEAQAVLSQFSPPPPGPGTKLRVVR